MPPTSSSAAHREPRPGLAAWPLLVEGEKHLPYGRALGSGGGLIWLRDGWGLYRRQALAWHLLSMPIIASLLVIALNPLLRAPALLLLPCLLAALAAAARHSWRREDIDLVQVLASVRPFGKGLLGIGTLGLLLYYLPTLWLLRSAQANGEPSFALRMLVAAFSFSALSFAAFLHCELGRGPLHAMVGSVIGFWKNLPAVLELAVCFVLAAIVLTGPFYLGWVFFFPHLPMRFAHMEWMMAAASLFLAPALTLSTYLGFRAVFIEEPPPDEDVLRRPLRF